MGQDHAAPVRGDHYHSFDLTVFHQGPTPETAKPNFSASLDNGLPQPLRFANRIPSLSPTLHSVIHPLGEAAAQAIPILADQSCGPNAAELVQILDHQGFGAFFRRPDGRGPTGRCREAG